MAATTSRFDEISFADLPNLRPLLNQRMPKSAMMSNILQLSLIERCPALSNRFYCFNANITAPEYAFILNIQLWKIDTGPIYFIVVLHPDEITPDMLEALENLLDWNTPIVFGNIDTPLLQHFTNLKTKHNAGKHASPLEIVHSFLLTAEDSLKLDAEADRRIHKEHDSLVIRELSPEDVEIVNRNWEGGHAAELIQTCIASIASAGVYLNEELVSWAIAAPTGTINALYTKEGHRRQGYADLTMKYLCKLNGTLGLHSITHVFPSNAASIKLMGKLGFVLTNSISWIDNCPCSECSKAGTKLEP